MFSNAEGAYGANVGMLIDAGAWSDEDEISQTYARRKCFAYGRKGQSAPQPELLQSVLGTVDFAYQNLDSVELGVTIDRPLFRQPRRHRPRRGASARRRQPAPIYISDQTRGEGKVRSLTEQVALETRTRILNPKWYEGMLKHGYEGVRQIEAHVTNTDGLVGDDRTGRPLGLRADHQDLRARSGNAQTPEPRSIRPHRRS